jgi:hypothetical protein
VFDICERIKEFDDQIEGHLLIFVMGDKTNSGRKFSIVEVEPDGHERFLWNTDELDARVLDKIRYMLHVPFNKRFAEAEKLEAKWREQNREKELDELVENLGLPMHRQLEHDGFIESRGKSYAKRGIRFA